MCTLTSALSAPLSGHTCVTFVLEISKFFEKQLLHNNSIAFILKMDPISDSAVEKEKKNYNMKASKTMRIAHHDLN